MHRIYEANCGLRKTDCNTKEEARRLVEELGSGYVVLFIRGSDGRDRSASMDKYVDGQWIGCNIHGGY